MKKTVILRKVCFIVLSSVFFMQATNAFADPEMGRHHGRPPHGPGYGYGDHPRYRYHDGRFYRPTWFGLFEIAIDIPPIGAIITVLPPRHRTIIVGDVTYYYYDGVYYTVCPSGYVVVPAPAPVVVPAAVVTPNPVTNAPAVNTQSQETSGETITINIPNTNGSYTPVILTKQKNGYTGPQGEYYSEHPTVEQLKVLYGK